MNYLLIGLIFVLAVLSALKEKYPKAKAFFWIILAILFVSLLVNIYIARQNAKKEQYLKSSGVISGELKNKNIIYPVLKLGEAKLVAKMKPGDPIFRIGNDAVKIWIEDDQLKISTVIRGKDGKIIAKLEANEWQVTNDPSLKWDKNFDEKAIEVINEKGEVVLQVEFDGEGVQFSGIFYREDGWRVVLGSFGEGQQGIDLKPPNEEIDVTFAPLFKYPSERHLGERN